MQNNNKTDWLGLCIEMMSEYFPVEIRSKSDSDKYWNINQHLLRVMEYTEPNRRHSGNAEQNERDDVVKDMIRLFSAKNMNSTEAGTGDTESDELSDNVALNNLLLLSIIG